MHINFYEKLFNVEIAQLIMGIILLDQIILYKHTSQEDALLNTLMSWQMFDQFNQWAMNETMKSVTPFNMGGYMQGEGFNPSDTDAAIARMDNINQMNDNVNDNNFNNFGEMGF
jgi:hypothetical protein